MSDLIERAAMYSRAAHQAVGQRRKYTGEPYYLHTEAVAHTIMRAGGTPGMIAAAYLHDTVEDTRITIDDLTVDFGAVISGYVYELTDQFVDPQIGNRASRKYLERERLSRISPEAQTIKYADLIDNTGSIAEHDPGFAKVYLSEKRELLNVMCHGDQRLWRKAWTAMVNGEATL